MKRYSVYISDDEYTYRYEVEEINMTEAENKAVRYHKAFYRNANITTIKAYELRG